MKTKQIDEMIKGSKCNCCNTLLSDYDTYFIEIALHLSTPSKPYQLCENHGIQLIRRAEWQKANGILADKHFEQRHMSRGPGHCIRLSTKDSRPVPLNAPPTPWEKKTPHQFIKKKVDESIKGQTCSCCHNLLEEFDTYCIEEGWHPPGKTYNLCEPHVRYLLRDIKTLKQELEDPKLLSIIKEYSYTRLLRMKVVRLSTRDGKRVPLHRPTTRKRFGEPR